MALFASGCAEDKGYGDPIDNPSAIAHANGAVSNTSALTTDTTNDSSLSVLNSISANMNILAGLKQQRDQQPTARLVQSEPLSVDEACVDVSETGVVYSDCDWNGTTVNGHITRSGVHVSVDIEFVTTDTDTEQVTTATAEVDISETAIVGYVDFDLEIRTDNGTISANFDGDFDVVLDQGCAVGGQVEIHAVARAAGQSQSVWVMAEYGPTCGDVVVR